MHGWSERLRNRKNPPTIDKHPRHSPGVLSFLTRHRPNFKENLMSETITVQANCPECDANISFDRPPLNGEIVRCTDCGAELEVVSTQPITLEIAPEVEGDWGE